MAGKDKMILRGIDFAKGDYFKRKNQGLSALYNTPINFLPKSEKTDDWKAAVSDYYEHIGLAKVSHNYNDIIKNRKLSVGKLDPDDYIRKPLVRAGINIPEPKNEDISGYDFYPLVPNLVNLFTGYQLKRSNKVVFSTVDPFSRAEMFETKDKILREELHKIRMEMRDNGGEVDEKKAHQQMMDASNRFKKYQDIGIDWANRVHKINYEKFGLRNLIKQAFKESYLNSSKVIFHINMMENHFSVEHIDEAYAFHGVSPNSPDITESGMIGWFRWMNIGDILDNFGKILKDEDIEKLKYINTVIGTQGGSLNLTNIWNNEAQDRTAEGGTAVMGSAEGYDMTKPYIAQPNEPLDIARYKRQIQETTGLSFDGRTIKQRLPDINPEFSYGDDMMFRTMYLYLESQRRIGWLTKVDRTGQVVFQDWINEDFIVTEEPIYNQQLLKEKTAENLIYGEHIDWEWVPDWRRFITISPNQSHASYSKLGANLEKIYIGGESLGFQFKNDKTPYGVKPPVTAIEIKQRGVKAVPMVSLLKQDQVLYNICKNRVKFTLRDDRGLQLVYPDNIIPRDDSDEEATDSHVDAFEKGMRKTKTIRTRYDRQYLSGNAQMGVPYTLDLSTIKYALEYDQLAERIFYNALRTVGFSPQAAAEIKASEEVSNVQSAQQISQVQTEIIYDEFNTRLLPDFYTKLLEATQYYSTINKDFRMMYLNDNDENTWIDITGINILHKDFACTPKYSFDNEEFTSMLKRMAMDNTIDAPFSTRLKALWKANENPAKVITMLEEAEERAQKNLEAAEKAKQDDLRAQFEHQKQLQDELLANENEQKDLDRQSKEYIAGMQFDNASMEPRKDTSNNGEQQVKNILKDKEINLKDSQAKEALRLQERQHQDNVSLKEQEILQKDRAGKMKLKEAIANRNKYSKGSTDKAAMK